MDKKQAEIEKVLLQHEKQAFKDLKKSYTQALSDIKGRVLNLQNSLNELNAIDTTGLDDRSKEILQSQKQSKIYQLEYQKMLDKQVGAIVEVLKQDTTTNIQSFLGKMYTDSFLGIQYDINSKGIPVTVPINPSQLVASVNKEIEKMTFAQRLNVNMNDFKKTIKSEISRGIANGSTYGQIAQQLSIATNEDINKSMRIVRTEGGRVSSEARLTSMRAAKEEGADIVKVWDSTLDHKTRETHAMLDGQVRELEEPFEIEDKEAMYPHGFGIASEDINCRCVMLEVPRWDLEETNIKIDNETEQLIEVKNYQDWKQGYYRRIAEEELQDASKNAINKVINGKNIIGEFTRRADLFEYEIEDVINYQGFDGVPRVVEKDEFEKLMQDSNFYAERAYSAETEEILEEYRNQLYNGKWYVDCSTGGAQYGQGMYCAASYDLTDKNSIQGIALEMFGYKGIDDKKPYSYIEGLTIDKSAKILHLPFKMTSASAKDYIEAEYRANYLQKIAKTVDEKEILKNYSDKWKKVIELQASDDYTGVGKLLMEINEIKKDDNIDKLIKQAITNSGNKDAGVMAVEMGYDGINAIGHGESGSYTVILNRTKVIFCKGGSIYGN